MAIVAELSIRSAIVTTLQGVTGIGNVWPRVRRPEQGREEDYNRIYVVTGKVNVCMVRRVQRIPAVDSNNRVTAVTQIYNLIFYRAFVDNDTDALASEAILQLLLENCAVAFEATPNLGVGHGVWHRGLALPTDFTDKYLGQYLCHEAECRLVVDCEDC